MLIIAALAAPPVYFYSIIYKYAVNVPYWDDYSAILDFLIRYQDADGALQRVLLLFAQNNEHRIAFGNLATVAMYKLTGMVDFRAMVFFGNAALLGLVLVFYRMFRPAEWKPLYFMPVVLFLFQPQFCDNMLWAMASVSNFYVLPFSFASLLLLQRGGRLFFAAAFLLAALSSVTQGSGIFSFAACALLLALKRDFRGLAVWCALSFAVLASYFWSYERPAHHPSVMKTVLEVPDIALEYFVTFTGASFPFPFFAGLIIIFLFVFLTFKGYYRKNPAVYCGLVLVFLTAAVAAVTRSGFGVEQALSSRYRIFSALFPILLYMAFFEHLQGRRILAKVFFPAVLAGSLMFNINANIIGLGKIQTINALFRNSITLWTMGADTLLCQDKERAHHILTESIERGLYNPFLLETRAPR